MGKSGPSFEDEKESGKLCSRECSIGNRKFSSLVVGIMIAVGLCAFIGIGKFKFTGSLKQNGAAKIDKPP